MLEQGGISQTDDWYCRKESGDPCKWPSIFRDYFCEDGYKFKKSWTVVGDLYDHLIEKKIAKKCGLKDLQPGDLIQYNEKTFFGWKDNWHHTAIVVEANPTNPKLVYHSDNKCNSDHNYVMKTGFDEFRGLCII